MSPFSSKTCFPSLVLLLSLLLGSCTITFPNYHRREVKTPAQLYPISPVDIPSDPHKGDLSVSAGFTTSGRDEEKPKTDYRSPEGKANLTSLTSATGTVSYALNDHWTLSAAATKGADSKIVDIKNYSQQVNLLEDVLLALITLGLYDGQTATPFQTLDKVERKYDYWNASLGAAYYLPATNKCFSVHAGVAKGGSQLTGTTHAQDARIYSGHEDAPPATYGTHQARYTSIYLQPSLRLRPETNSLNFGLASRLSYYGSTVNTRISDEIKYTEKVQHLLLQPSVFAAFGGKHLKFNVAYSRLVPLANKTRDHFNANYFHFGLQARIPTKPVPSFGK